MNRVTLLAVLVLVLAALAAWGFERTAVRLDGAPPALALPEALPLPGVSLAAEPTLAGTALLALAALLLLGWRRGSGQAVWPALLAAALLLLHPALRAGVATPAARLDLAALGAVLLGARWLLAERTGLVAGGVLLLFAAVLVAPSGAPLAALAAFALAERVPSMQRGALLLLFYGVARAFGGPWLGTLMAGEALRGPALALGTNAPLRLLAETAAAVLPLRPIVTVPVAAPWWIGALVAGCALLAVLVPSERRFGSRLTGTAALLALGLAAAAAWHDGGLGPMAAAPAVVLLAIWIAGLVDEVEPGPTRPALGWTLGVAWLVFAGWRLVEDHPLRHLPRAWFAAAAVASPEAAAQDGRSLAALRARLAAASPAEVFALADARLQAPAAAPGRLAAAVDRELGIAAALAGSPGRGADLLARAVESGGGAVAAAAVRDRLDVLVRAGRAADAVASGERALAAAAADSERAELLARLALAHVARAFGGRAGVSRDAEATRARECFAAALAADPRCARAWLERGRFHVVTGAGIEAVKDLEQCARLRPEQAAPHLDLARLYFTRRQDQAGERELAEARRLAGPADPEVLLVTAELQLARGDLIGALEQAEKLEGNTHRLRGAGEELADLHRRLARTAEDSGNAGLAEALARKALAGGRDPTGETTLRLVRLLRQARRFDEAVRVLRAAQQRGDPVPDHRRELVNALKNAGYDRFMHGDKTAAWELFLAAVSTSETFEELGALPSLLRTLSDELPEADQELVTAQAKRAFEAAVAALRDERLADAERLLLASRDLLPANPYVHYHLGLLYEKGGKAAAARAAFQKAVAYGEAIQAAEVVLRSRAFLQDPKLR